MDAGEKERIELELMLLRAKRGEGAALEYIVRRFERPLLYYLRRLTGNEPDAWDALQRTWLGALSSIRTVREAGAFKAWLYRVARNVALNQMRDAQRYREALLEKAAESAPDEEFPGPAAERAEEVHFALDRLELPQREVLTLFFIEQMSVREISVVLDCPVGTVKWRLHQARNHLRDILEKRNG